MEHSFPFINRKCPSHMLRIHNRDILMLSERKELQYFHPSFQCVMKIRVHTTLKSEQPSNSHTDNSRLLNDLFGIINVLSSETRNISIFHSSETILEENLKGEKVVTTRATPSLEDTANSTTSPMFLFTSDCSRRRKCSTKNKNKKTRASQEWVSPIKKKARNVLRVTYKKRCVSAIHETSGVNDQINDASSNNNLSSLDRITSSRRTAMNFSGTSQPFILRERRWKLPSRKSAQLKKIR